ncbi:hypothetical protein F5883DRAFT_633663 [Diaporthe sp. PMI_573]|nr:hypothetical protein F5883DRAFT_633663 [Diaporthaceae sp. PMI_573]
MNLQFQDYDPFTKSFKPSLAKESHNRISESKKPGRVRSKLVSSPSPEMSEQSVDFSDDEFRPSERLSATTGVIDLTRSDIVLPPEQCRGPLNQNSTGDGNCQEKRNAMYGADDRPSGPISRPSIILSQRHDGPSTSDVQRSNLAMSGTDDRPATNYAPYGATPLATLKGTTSLDRANGARSATLTDLPAHDAGHIDPQSLKKTVDVDDVHGYGGQSTMRTSAGPEQGHSADVAADGEWEITELIGKEIIHGEVHYLVRWKATLVREHEINAPELIGKFEAKFGTKTNKPVGEPELRRKLV